MPKSQEIPLEVRAIILAYRFQLQFTFDEIADRLLQSKSTIHSFCNRVYKDAQSDDLFTLLEHVKNNAGRGRKELVKPGSRASVAIRENVRGSLKYQEQFKAANAVTNKTVLKELDVNIPRLSVGTVHKVLKHSKHCQLDPFDQKPIKRKRELLKPDDYNPQKRLKHCSELEELIQANAVLVVCDEKKYGFGGTANYHVSAPAGVDVYGHEQTTRFVREQWAAACAQDLFLKRPHIVWSEEDKTIFELPKQLEERNQQARAIVDSQRWRAVNNPESTEFKDLQKDNDKIKDDNSYNKAHGISSVKPKLTPARKYPYQDLRMDAKGLDFCWYGFKVYKELLFPYITSLREANPGRRVVIIEDNSPVHLKARRLLDPLISELAIEFADHPAHSPDLNTIETLQREHEKFLEPFMWTVRSRARAIKREADNLMKKTWQDSSFDPIVTRYCSLEAFQDLVNKIREADGHNTFKDQ